MSNRIINELESFLEKSDNQKSSFWKYYLDEKKIDFYNINQASGFGSFTKKKIF